MPTHVNDRCGGEIEVLLNRGFNPHRTALEDYVAYQWEAGGDLLGQRHGEKRNTTTLNWLADAVKRAEGPATVLDIGCSYGNHLFMLNALLGKPLDVEFIGVDLFEGAVRRANAFASAIPGFANCRFQLADLGKGLPFEDDTFDAINLCDVIEHMPSPGDALAEIRRVAKPGATLVISTPLKDSLFKRIASFANRMCGGRIYAAYYKGKDTHLDEHGQPVMETTAGHDHVSEMTLPELKKVCVASGFRVAETELMGVMSGSRWFDQHLVMLSGILLLETLHEYLRRPSWAHSVMLRLRNGK